MLLIRLDAIGDALALTPLLEAFARASIPVDLVLQNANLHALSGAASRNRFTAPFALRSRSRENLRTIAAFADRIRSNSYTHTIVATEDPGGYELARHVDSPIRIGFTNGWEKPLKTLWLRGILTNGVQRRAGLDPLGRHECEVLFDLGRSLLPDPTPTRNAQALRPLVLDSEVPREDRIVVQITDKWERLGIAFEDFVRAVRLISQCGVVRAISSAAESNYAQRVARAASVEVELFDSLLEWKNAIVAGRALIAPDGGAIHVAGMTGTPTVAVFPSIADFARQSARWSPWAAPSRIVEADNQWPERAAAELRLLLRETEQGAR